MRHPLRLLHVVGDDNDGHVVGDFADGLLNPIGRRGVERRTRLVHQQNTWPHRQGPGDTQSLLLPTREASAQLVEPVLDLVPQPGPGQHLLDEKALPSRARVWSGKTSVPKGRSPEIVMAGNGFGFWNTMPMCLRASVARRPPP